MYERPIKQGFLAPFTAWTLSGLSSEGTLRLSYSKQGRDAMWDKANQFCSWRQFDNATNRINFTLTGQNQDKNIMKLVTKSEMCVRKNCPSLYRDKDGSFYVQGYRVADAKQKLPALSKRETLVRIDASLVKKIKESGVVC